MTVSPMVVAIDTKKTSVGQLRVVSKSSQTQYVKVAVKRVLNPATEQESEVSAPLTGDGAVTVSPSKFVLPAGGSRLVRVISLTSPANEELYRVHFEAVTAPSEEEADPTDDGVTGKVDFGLIWAPLVRVIPTVRTPLMAVSNGMLNNTGNMRLGVLEVGACDSEKADAKCEWRSVERNVYPGQSLNLPHAVPARAFQFKYLLDGVNDTQLFSVSGDTAEVPGA